MYLKLQKNEKKCWNGPNEEKHIARTLLKKKMESSFLYIKQSGQNQPNRYDIQYKTNYRLAGGQHHYIVF